MKINRPSKTLISTLLIVSIAVQPLTASAALHPLSVLTTDSTTLQTLDLVTNTHWDYDAKPAVTSGGGVALDRAFMVMGYVFCLSTVFVLSKAVRDSHQAALTGEAETPMWRLVVWGGFLLAMSLTGWGLWRMEVHETYKAFLGVSWLYLITCTFTLAKTLRDHHEVDVVAARLARRSAATSADGSR